MTGKAYRKSKLWRLALHLATAIHTLSAKLPADAKGSIGFAIGRAGMTLPAGFAAAHGNEEKTIEACEACLATLRELDTHLIVARRVNALTWWQCREVRWWMRRLEKCADWMLSQCNEPILAELDEDDGDEPEADGPHDPTTWPGVLARLFVTRPRNAA